MKLRSFPTMATIFICLTLIFVPYASADDNNRVYTVKKGDTLWDISSKFYSDPFLWPALWALNQERLTNPHWISVGDELIIYDEEVLKKKAAEMAPAMAKAPEVAKAPESLYETGKPIETIFPKYFTYMASPGGIEGSGVNRIRVKKVVFETQWVVEPSQEVRRVSRKKVLNTYADVYEVGTIIASEETGYQPPGSSDIHGKSMLSFFDNVVVHFTKDIAGLLESAAQGDPDPYFREYPIYALGRKIKEPEDKTGRQLLGTLFHFKGVLTVVARVQTSKVLPEKKKWYSFSLASKTKVIDRDPVFYIARITESKDPIYIGDKVFIFKRLE
ncbi:MAG: LysM peptidoglycan-binding domain-containing protein [Deltaproteobacteria bacterium]|nr:LysM peptidoglycan-binding domain-containing protein [Deltaproteobacteria bacterium]